jgi:DME family drug/metabolite transporter
MTKTEGRTSNKGAAKFKGELWALLAVFGYSGGNLFGRAGVTFANPIAGPLLRDLPTFVMGLVLLLRGKHQAQLVPGSATYQGKKLALFAFSGAVSVIGNFAFFFALKIGGVNVAVPVLQTQLLWGALFGWIILGERVLLRGTLGIAVTFLGLVVLALGQSSGVPVSASWPFAMALALVTALAWGLSGVIWRRGQTLGVDRSTGMSVHYGVSVIISALFLAVTGQLGVYQTIGWESLTSLLLSGVFGGVIGAFALFTAIKLLPAATVFVLNGLTPLVTALGGAWFLGEYINATMWVGIVLTSIGVVVFQLVKPMKLPSAPAAGRRAT